MFEPRAHIKRTRVRGPDALPNIYLGRAHRPSTSFAS